MVNCNVTTVHARNNTELVHRTATNYEIEDYSVTQSDVILSQPASNAGKETTAVQNVLATVAIRTNGRYTTSIRGNAVPGAATDEAKARDTSQQDVTLPSATSNITKCNAATDRRSPKRPDSSSFCKHQMIIRGSDSGQED